MVSGLGFAHPVRAELFHKPGDSETFDLPLWIGSDDGRVHIALPVSDPQHATDMVQVIVPLHDLLGAVSRAVADNQSKRR